MRKSKGLTPIELVIYLAIFGIVVALVFGTAGAKKCVQGYVFVIDARGHYVQVIDENEKGIRCER